MTGQTLENISEIVIRYEQSFRIDLCNEFRAVHQTACFISTKYVFISICDDVLCTLYSSTLRLLRENYCIKCWNLLFDPFAVDVFYLTFLMHMFYYVIIFAIIYVKTKHLPFFVYACILQSLQTINKKNY